jgi:hypothetical protein
MGTFSHYCSPWRILFPTFFREGRAAEKKGTIALSLAFLMVTQVEAVWHSFGERVNDGKKICLLQ